MKKIQIFSGAMLVMLVISAGIFNACNKDEDPLNSSECQNNMMSEADKSFQNKLIDFRDQLEYQKSHPLNKNGEEMEIDEAIILIEALFNASYSFNHETFSESKLDETTIYLSISNDFIAMEDIVVSYDEILELVTTYYHNCDFDDKAFLMLDMEKGSIENGQVSVALKSVVGKRGDSFSVFGPFDYWWYGGYLGDCDFNHPGTDAAEKIQDALMSNKPIASPPPGYRFVYENYENIELFGHEYQDESGNNLIFCLLDEDNNGFTHDEQCLNPDEMNYHFMNEWNIIYEYLPSDLNKPANWTFMWCDLLGIEEYINPNNHFIRHNNALTYAERHLVEVGIVDPPITLE